jgi:hypothetical protein
VPPESGDFFAHDHGVGNAMAFVAEERDDQRFVVVPMMTFEPSSSSAPGTLERPLQQSKLLRERCGVACRTRAETTRLAWIGTQIEVTLEAGELLGQALSYQLFHVVRSARENQKGYPEREATTLVSTP